MATTLAVATIAPAAASGTAGAAVTPLEAAESALRALEARGYLVRIAWFQNRPNFCLSFMDVDHPLSGTDTDHVGTLYDIYVNPDTRKALVKHMEKTGRVAMQ